MATCPGRHQTRRLYLDPRYYKVANHAVPFIVEGWNELTMAQASALHDAMTSPRNGSADTLKRRKQIARLAWDLFHDAYGNEG